MRTCPACHFPNRPDAKYCNNCESELTATPTPLINPPEIAFCPACHARNRPGARFCAYCHSVLLHYPLSPIPPTRQGTNWSGKTWGLVIGLVVAFGLLLSFIGILGD